MQQSTRWVRYFFLSLIVGAFSSSSFAQEICNSLLQHGIYELAREVTSDSSSSVVRSEFSRMYDEYNKDVVAGSVKASYGGFRGKASFSSEQIRAIGESLFESNYSAQQAQNDEELFRQTINITAVDAWRDCTTQFADNLRVKTDYGPNLDGPLTIEMSFIADSLGETKTVRKITVSPEDAFNCKGALMDALNDGDPYELGPEPISLTCERTIADAPFKHRDEDVYAKSATVIVDTAAGMVTRSFVSILANPPQPSLETRITDLESQINTLEQKLSSATNWTDIPPQSHWWLYSNGWPNPSYMRDALGFVHLRGLVVFQAPTRETITILPEGFRPQTLHEFAVACADNTIQCTVIVTPEGKVYFETSTGPIPDGNESSGWNSLDGVTFQAKSN